MKEVIFADLGRALKAMDYDFAQTSIRRMGPNGAFITEETNTPSEVSAEAAEVQYYPNKAVYNASRVSYRPQIASANEINDYFATGAQDIMDNEYIRMAAQQSEGVIDSTTSLVESVSPEAAQTLKEKLAAMTPGQKVAAGIGVYIGGKAAMQFIPTKYLLIGGAAYLWSQMKKAKAVENVQATVTETAEVSTPVAGLG